MTNTQASASPQTVLANQIQELRSYAIRGLPRMYCRKSGLFSYQVVKKKNEIHCVGSSLRYSSIAFIGLSGEPDDVIKSVFGDKNITEMFALLCRDISKSTNLGDISLLLWAANLIGYEKKANITRMLKEKVSGEENFKTVELCWTLDALCLEEDSELTGLRMKFANLLINSFKPKSSIFPHTIGPYAGGFRSHVSCFADLVYPIHTLANYSKKFNDPKALDIARQCAQHICSLQGKGGQWWWHYDYRTGKVLEGYPVYSVHQDAMAPMALLALEEAGGGDYWGPISKGLQWLYAPQETSSSLIDTNYDLIWRKVGRREPRKMARYLQAVVSKINDGLRVPALDLILPPTRIDFETRPYHIGWILYAFNRDRVKRIT